MSNTRILVAEDERIVGRALQKELEFFGYSVSGIAATAQEAVDRAVAEKPDLVLMDIHLQGRRDGIDAAREIYTRCSIPVVYLSAFADADTLARAKDTGAYGYLTKPYEEKELFTTIEITLAKHRAERRLEETERWLAALLAGINDAVIATDVELGVRYMNRAASHLTGLKKEEASGIAMTAVCRLLKGDRPIDLASLTELAIRKNARLEFPANSTLVAWDGEETPVEGGVSPIHDASGRNMGVLLSLRDVTARRRLEQYQNKQERNQRLTHKMETLSRLAGGMVRHLNDQLTVVLGNTSLVLSQTNQDPSTHAELKDVEAAALRTAEIVERLRVFSDYRQCDLQPIDLNDLINNLLERLQGMLDPSIAVTFQPGPALWRVQADEVQIAQAILILCLDARKELLGGGQLILNTENLTLNDGHALASTAKRHANYVRLRIAATRFSLPRDDGDRVCEAMYTVGDADQSIDLDLAIAFAIAEQHHGWIECWNEVEGATQFDFYLPRDSADLPAVVAQLPGNHRKSLAPTILLAEDEPLVREVGRRILDSQGYRVLLAENGDQALAMFQQKGEHVDLVILDLNLPGPFGNDVVEQLVEFNPDVRVLFSSGYFSEDLTGEDGHTRGVINKPYRQEELISMVRRALGEHTTNRSPADDDLGNG